MKVTSIATSLLALIWLALPAATIGETTKQRPFSLQQLDGNAWLVKPDGERFFSLGVCVVNQGASREEFSPTNPGYAAYQHYENSNRWADATMRRLESWRFTTIGGWSDYQALQQCRDADVAFTPVLHVGSTVSEPWIYEDAKPVSGRKTTDVVNSSTAVLLWEMPYWTPAASPHHFGLNLVFADTHAGFEKRSPKEFDWWSYHSRRGWEDNVYTGAR